MKVVYIINDLQKITSELNPIRAIFRSRYAVTPFVSVAMDIRRVFQTSYDARRPIRRLGAEAG